MKNLRAQTKHTVREFKIRRRESSGNYEVNLYSLLYADCMSLFFLSCNWLMRYCGVNFANAMKAAAF
jgi:hypothetical protein